MEKETVVVAKFGGSSLADSEQIKKVADIVRSDKNRKFVVVSAPGKRHGKDQKVTDLLYLCHNMAEQDLEFEEIFKVIETRYKAIRDELGLSVEIEKQLEEIKDRIANGATPDYTASRGEYLNGILIAAYLEYEFIDAAELVVFKRNGICDLDSTKLKIKERTDGIERAVIPGFYGATADGRIRTFSRGGSDVTGSLIAQGVEADLYENWTDVSGFLMADPRIVENPKPIKLLTYKELRELSYMGATVLHEDATYPVRLAGIKMNIKNTNEPEHPGTLIMDDEQAPHVEGIITGIAGKKDFSVISVDKPMMAGEVGFVRKLLSIMEMNDVSVEHFPTGIDSVSLVVADSEIENKWESLLEEIKIQCEPDSVVLNPNMALMAIVGRGMIRSKGISAKLFGALYKNDINVRMITQGAGELNIIVGVENEDFEKGIKSVYEAFVK